MRIQIVSILLISLALNGGALLYSHTTSATTSRSIGITLKESEAKDARPPAQCASSTRELRPCDRL